MDSNTVCAGVAKPPSMWFFCGSNQIQELRRKNVLIDYERQQKFVGAMSYEQLKRDLLPIRLFSGAKTTI